MYTQISDLLTKEDGITPLPPSSLSPTSTLWSPRLWKPMTRPPNSYLPDTTLTWLFPLFQLFSPTLITSFAPSTSTEVEQSVYLDIPPSSPRSGAAWDQVRGHRDPQNSVKKINFVRHHLQTHKRPSGCRRSPSQENWRDLDTIVKSAETS